MSSNYIGSNPLMHKSATIICQLFLIKMSRDNYTEPVIEIKDIYALLTCCCIVTYLSKSIHICEHDNKRVNTMDNNLENILFLKCNK